MKSLLSEYLTPVLKGKKIILGVSGSIAAFKTMDLIRGLKECGAEVRVVMTASASEFVTKTTLETLSENPVLNSLWGSSQGTHHIETARWADIFICAPATANLISKLTWGVADDLLTTEILAFQGPVLIVPAMNPQMYQADATTRNINELLKRKNYSFCGPIEGVTACGEQGLGRMIEVESVIEHCASFFYKTKNHKKALVSFGPTVSFYDPVRFLSNRSSGKMGCALVWALTHKGYDVTAVGNNINLLPLPSCVSFLSALETKDMAEKIFHEFEKTDLMLSSAAVLDFEFLETKKEKVKKSDSHQIIELKKTTDILAQLGECKKSHQYLLGFAAETQNLRENAELKKKNKNLDAVFANNVAGVETGFNADSNEGIWIGKEVVEFKKDLKIKIAHLIISQIEKEW